MRYTVIRRDKALQQLARIWMNVVDKDALDRASNRIDVQMTVDPETKGGDYYGDRILTMLPLCALFTVRTSTRIVETLQVGQPGLDWPHQSMP